MLYFFYSYRKMFLYTQDVQVDQTNCRDTFGNPFGMNHRFYWLPGWATPSKGGHWEMFLLWQFPSKLMMGLFGFPLIILSNGKPAKKGQVARQNKDDPNPSVIFFGVWHCESYEFPWRLPNIPNKSCRWVCGRFCWRFQFTWWDDELWPCGPCFRPLLLLLLL